MTIHCLIGLAVDVSTIFLLLNIIAQNEKSTQKLAIALLVSTSTNVT